MSTISLRGFQDVLNAQLTAAAITSEIAWPNSVYVPKKGVSYIAPACTGRGRTPLGFGTDGVQMWQGTYQVSVFVPRDTGDREQNAIASKVLAAFSRGLTLQTAQGIRVIVSYSTAGIPVAFGDWSNLPVVVSWFATEP